MRVIAGSAKGVRLGPVPPGTRPLSDRAREGVFSSLAGVVPGASVLDLFAGTGALGIEALSRGAERAVFVDEARAAVDAIRDNLARTRLDERATVRQAPVLGFLAGPVGSPYDVVFADPPHATDSGEIVRFLSALVAASSLAAGAMVALTRAKRNSIDVIPVELLVAKTLTYGDTLVHLIREDPRARKRSVSGDV